ncbi:OLC1v1003044C1 [Oldenlandia corymbosa var. corymbosa]|uniref:OLC1v1003044C1 n=1 Tax=Oldenlandia corymbosa var. corymbosa TaxID=529605 RepID=A0AAV1DBH5_OLDCO|nr:OLC1v1003044C1 [Oldenlandia corymbosa var. corymbosa]
MLHLPNPTASRPPLLSPPSAASAVSSFTISASVRHFFSPLRHSPFHSLHSSSATVAFSISASGTSTLAEQLESSPEESREDDDEDDSGFGAIEEAERFDFDGSFESAEFRRFDSPAVEVKELDELPEQWRRSKLAWLCKELPAHKPATVIRVLNAQRKWMRQDDANYVVIHCMRIRENETAFRVYKWMMGQHWFRFDFGLATKLADYMGKQQKYLKCREIFDDILNQGRVPNESTFHILVGSYLSSSSQGCIEEACNIYNRMIQLGGYRPRLSLHNALLRALVSKPGVSCKNYLKQAEFIFHNLTTCGLEIHKDIYGSLIWLHSYQDVIDKQRIESLRADMQSKGYEEGREVLVSVLRACSKEGDLDGAQKAWTKLLSLDGKPPPQAFVYFMEVYGKVGEPLKSLTLFRNMQELLGSTSVVAYQKIIEVTCKAQNKELAESLMAELIHSGLKPLSPSFMSLMAMYSNLGLHDELEAAFMECLEKCRPNRTIYNIYLESLVQIGNLERAEEIFSQMHGNATIGVNARSCNSILAGYLAAEDHVKTGKVHALMCQKRYEIESHLKEMLNNVLSRSRKVSKAPPRLKLSEDQREILVGMLLGGLKIVSSEEKKVRHAIQFDFSETSDIHTVLRKHIHDAFHEWLECRDIVDGSNNVPPQFSTIFSSCFNFYAEQFRSDGRPAIPKLIHRWLSPRVLAYWYMYGGHRTSRGDILLKVKGSQEGILSILKELIIKSLDSRVKKKGSVFWIGFEGCNASRFWNIVEPFILDDLCDPLRAGAVSSTSNDLSENQSGSFEGGFHYDKNASDCSDSENF